MFLNCIILRGCTWVATTSINKGKKGGGCTFPDVKKKRQKSAFQVGSNDQTEIANSVYATPTMAAAFKREVKLVLHATDS